MLARYTDALALHEAAYRGQIPASELDGAVDRLEKLPVALAGGGPEHRRSALAIARSLSWAKTYDAEYVAVARSLDCVILSTDIRLIHGAARLAEFIQPTDLAD